MSFRLAPAIRRRLIGGITQESDSAVPPSVLHLFSEGMPDRHVADRIVKELSRSREWGEFREGLRRTFAAARKAKSVSDTGVVSPTLNPRQKAILPVLGDLTPHGWARLAGLDPKTVSNYFRYRTDLSQRNRLKLASVLGKKPDEIFPD
jgi:hypothetical protein